MLFQKPNKCYNDFFFIFCFLSTVHFKAVSCADDKQFPKILTLLECFLEPTFCDGALYSYRIVLNLLYGMETTSFQSYFKI